MKAMMRRLLITPIAAIVLSASALAQAAPDPQKAQTAVEDATEEMLSVLRNAGDDVDAATIEERLRAIILPRLDFITMTKLAVGRPWVDATSDQKRALVREFRDLLVRTYSRSLTEYEDQKLAFQPLEPGSKPDRATVRLRIIENDGSKVPVHFSLHHKDGEWLVFDITIDGVSLVKTYRSSFTSQIQEGGIDGLVARLQEKNEAGESANVAP
jgi:phospholipid transport system substrate-binding protein